MTQIALTDAALVRLLESCDFPGVTVESAPHEWDGSYVQRLIQKAPALLVAFVGAEPYNDTATSTELSVAGKWNVYIVTGWDGADQKARRLGAGAGFDLMHRAAAALHTAILTEPNGDRLPQVQVDGLGVESDSAIDISNLWVGSIPCTIELPLPILPSDACYGPLDDFLRVRGEIEVTDPAPDVGLSVDLPQT